MSFDTSGAEQLVREIRQMSEDFRAHDPALSAELSAKAEEICREMGLDIGLSGPEMPIEPALGFLDAATMAEHDGDQADDETSKQVVRTLEDSDAIDEEDQLLQILDHQKAILDAKAEDELVQAIDQPRSQLPGLNMVSSWLRLETA